MITPTLDEAGAESPRREPGARPRPPIARSSRMRPELFDGHLGWLHLPEGGTAVRGAVLLCPPLGREARSAHRPLWLLAERLAADGFAALRYDHLGSGDSGELRTGNGWAEWLEGAAAAAALLRERLDHPRIVLGGLRLGASLAAAVAGAVRPDALMLLAPVVKGGQWLRELEIAGRMSGFVQATGEDLPFESNGLVLSPATARALSQLDLLALGAAAPEALLASPRPAAALERRLAALGARVAAVPFEGYDDLLLEAFANQPPLALFDRVRSWLQAISQDWAPAAIAQAPASPAVLTVPSGRELPIVFGPGLQGVLCLPDQPRSRRAVVFANTGGDPRAGIGGFAARASRTLAAGGLAALRFDFAGLGDSPCEGPWRSHVYETPRRDDLAAAVTLLQGQGWEEVYLAGVCSGGYHCIHAALANERIAGVFAVNPSDWLWPAGAPIIIPTREEIVSSRTLVSDLARQVRTPQAWRGLLRGEGQVAATAAALAERLSRLRKAGPHARETRALRGSVARMLARGGRMRVLVGQADNALDELEVRFGFRGGWLARRAGASVRILSGLDHGLAYQASRDMVLAELLDFVAAGRTAAAAQPSPRLQAFTLTPSPAR